MRIRKVILSFILVLGAALVADAQSVRSTTYRPTNTRTIVGSTQTAHGYHRGWHGGARWGVGGYVSGNGWAVGGYWGSGYVGGHGYYRPYYPTYRRTTILPVYRSYGPRFIHVPPRVVAVVAPPIEQVIPVPAPPPKRVEAKTITIPEGTAIFTKDGMVIENRDGKLLIYQREE